MARYLDSAQFMWLLHKVHFMNDWHLFTFYFQIYNVNCVAAAKAGSASAAKQARERVKQSHG